MTSGINIPSYLGPLVPKTFAFYAKNQKLFSDQNYIGDDCKLVSDLVILLGFLRIFTIVICIENSSQEVRPDLAKVVGGLSVHVILVH